MKANISSHLQEKLTNIVKQSRLAVGQFHVLGHSLSCQLQNSIAHKAGSGRTGGEEVLLLMISLAPSCMLLTCPEHGFCTEPPAPSVGSGIYLFIYLFLRAAFRERFH